MAGNQNDKEPCTAPGTGEAKDTNKDKIRDLKATAYDIIATIEQGQRAIEKINNQIRELTNAGK